MTIQEMVTLKNERGYSYAQLSELSGVPAPTIQKVFSSETKRPRYKTLRALEDAFQQLAAETSGAFNNYPPSIGAKHSPSGSMHPTHVAEDPTLYTAGAYTFGNQGSSPSVVEESFPTGYRVRGNTVESYIDDGEIYPSKVKPRKPQGSYTIEDYYAWPEDERVELIDGVIYDMGAPLSRHQLAVGEAHRQIANFIHEHGGPCLPGLSPMDVQLDCDEKTMLQPDVMIICKPDEKLKRKGIYGAPDFVMEVISPSTRDRDFSIKLRKYRNAGVREYWIVDIPQETIFVYYFEEANFIGIYNLYAEIPVRIYNGALTLCFEPIRKWLEAAKD